MSKIIVIDPGHGGNDPGATNGSRYESADNLKLGQLVKKKLTYRGLTVVMTRETDATVSLAQRTTIANNAKADLFVSLHRNSYTNSTANGTEIWVYTTAGAVDEAAAGAVLEQLADVGIQSNRGVKKGNYHVLRESHMTSMLIELGFISNAIDNQLFDQNFDAYAEAIVKGICDALGIDYSSSGAASDYDPKYKVQVGAFAVESNARAFLEQVQGMGLPAFLIIQETAKAE